ncbi:ABC transporter permease subunit [Bifidobacterium sp.]|jgi:glutathione transport system permease protein|uniref:ABC transporter permease subunit n=1 Tax=Bifidobacterium sp. TaxID=41200 RepID=UPI0025BFA2ED|nr:ABC transporter permease subunit [Bifidobacterium sp.]MCH4209712.1 ABC transporter permease subunit [Bifidobacterium sp.]MCI1224518.1 ABC transporter permease subunit [Bifidobacterium sp.]
MTAQGIVVEDNYSHIGATSPVRAFFSSFLRQRNALIAAIFIALLVVVVILAPVVAPYNFSQADYNSVLQGPSARHLFGTDSFGRDIFSRVLYGGRISLAVGVSSVAVAAVIGSILGLLAAFYGGWLDSIIMRFSDVLFAFPGIILAIGIIAILGPGLFNVVVAVAIFGIPNFARIVRGSALEIQQSEYIEVEHSLGASNARIIFSHIFPGTFASIIVNFTMRLGNSILTAASLSFLGLGAQPPSPEWGAMLSDGRDYIATAPYVAFFPGLAIFLTILAFNVFGDGLRDALDPKVED